MLYYGGGQKSDPEKGSLGASKDLAPTSHLGLVLIGEGEAFYKGRRMPGAQALKKSRAQTDNTGGGRRPGPGQRYPGHGRPFLRRQYNLRRYYCSP